MARPFLRFFAAMLAAASFSLPGASMAAEPAKKPSYPTFGSLESKDARFDKLVPPSSKLEKLASGFKWTEGPLWIAKDKCLLFSDIPNNRIMKWKEGTSEATVYLEPAGYTGSKPRGGEPGSNGLILDSEGRLVLCDHGDRRIARLNEDGKTKSTIVDKYDGKRLNSPNDACYKSNGDLYFTDPPYGLEKNWDDPARELDFCGVYRYSKDGKLTLLTKELARPNGIAFSPDEKILYVAQSDPKKAVLMAYNVKADGTIDEGRVFFDMTPWAAAGKKGLPDGLKIDASGNLFATGPGGVHVFSPDGAHLGTIDTGEKTSNVNWGDDGSVLYITADSHLARIKTATKGNGWK